jgi:hypothetical protein
MSKISESASILTGDEKSIKLDTITKKVTKETVTKKVIKETVAKKVTKEKETDTKEKETDTKEKETDTKEKETDTKEKETDTKEKVINKKETDTKEKVIDKKEVKDKIKKATSLQKSVAVIQKEDVNIIKKQKMPKTKLGLPVKNILVTPESIKKLWVLIKSR